MASRNELITATLKDSSGAGISGKTINISFAVTGSGATPTAAGTGTTDTNGVVAQTIALPAPATYDVFASFAGDSQYDSANGSDLAVLVKVKTSLTVTAVAQ